MSLCLKSTGLAVGTLVLVLAAPTLFTPYSLPPVLAQVPTTQAPFTEADRLLQKGREQFQTSQFEAALQSWQQALATYRELKDQHGEEEALGNLGTVYNSLSRYDKAKEYHQKALDIARELNDNEGEARALSGLGNDYQSLGQPRKAIEYHQQALEIAREIKNPQVQAVSLRQLGSAYQSLGQSSQASAFQQQYIAIQQNLGEQWNQENSSGNVIVADPSGNLFIVQSAVNRNTVQVGSGGITQTIPQGNGGFIQVGPGGVTQTIPQGNGGFIQVGPGGVTQTIPQGNGGFIQVGPGGVTQTIPQGNGGFIQVGPGGVTQTIRQGNGGFIQVGPGGITQTIRQGNGDFIQVGPGGVTQTIPQGNGGFIQVGPGGVTQTIRQGNGSFIRLGNGSFLQTVSLGNAGVGKDSGTIKFFQQALVNARSASNSQGIADSLVNLGDSYQAMGQYQDAVDSYEQHLETIREIPGHSRTTEANALGNLGNAYQALGQYQQAMNYHQQHLTLAREIEDKQGEANALGNLGNDYAIQGDYEKAISFYQQQQNKAREIRDHQGEANALGNMGDVYQFLGRYTEAMDFYQQSLAIKRSIHDLSGEGVTLANIARLLSKQNQPQSAIVFYKQSINITESIRQNLRGLPQDQQQSYTQTVEPTYRQLVDLLLSQGRLLEAQQILELLKVQEIDRIDREIRASLKAGTIEYTATETDIKKKHGDLIALGEKLYGCETNTCNAADLQQWQTERHLLQVQFDQTVETAEAQAKNRMSQSAIEGKEDFIKGYQSIVEAQSGTLLVYPFVTDDKIWLLWASAGGVLGSTEVPTVGRQKLLNAVKALRDDLETPSSDPVKIQQLQRDSQQLYQWLIKPLEPALVSKSIKHLVFSLDSTTRYVPMSVLFDGTQYLIERYTVSTVLNAGLTDSRDRLPTSPQATTVLALGVSQGFPGFHPLDSVKAELDAIVQSPDSKQGIYPGEKLLNAAFDEQAFNHLHGQKIVHIATHADFLSTDPKSSYLLLGNGHQYPIREIQFLRNLSKVHLVVLSACKTALAENDPDGKEILGISAYFTGGNSKAKAVLASLWEVNDASTSQLMQQFYQNLATGKMTKAEALQRAQLSLLKSNRQSNLGNAVDRTSVQWSSKQSTGSTARNLSHPYYWAPFILIGNGL